MLVPNARSQFLLGLVTGCCPAAPTCFERMQLQTEAHSSTRAGAGMGDSESVSCAVRWKDRPLPEAGLEGDAISLFDPAEAFGVIRMLEDRFERAIVSVAGLLDSKDCSGQERAIGGTLPTAKLRSGACFGISARYLVSPVVLVSQHASLVVDS